MQLHRQGVGADVERRKKRLPENLTGMNQSHFVGGHVVSPALNGDQMRARVKNAGANLAIVRRFVLNLFRLDPSKRKGGIHTRCILAASSDSYREALLGLGSV